MKKLLLISAIFCSCVLISFSSCNMSDEYDIDEDDIIEETDAKTEEDTEEVVESYDETTVGDDMESEPAENRASSIHGGTNFIDGFACVEHCEDNQGDQVVKKLSVIDNTGKIIFSIDEYPKSQTRFGGDSLENALGNGILVYNNIIYDMTGRIIASPEISGYDKLISKNCSGYVLAMKREESFEGDKYYIGVLNNKGEWKYPLSYDHPIVKCFEENEGLSRLDEYFGNFVSDTTITFGAFNKTYYYDLLTDELTNDYIHYESRHFLGEQAGIYRHELSGDLTLVVPDIVGKELMETAFIGTEIETTGYASYNEKGTHLYDYSGKKLIDLSDYELVLSRGAYYFNEHLLVEAVNKTGVHYLCLVNQLGENVFEPIRLEGIYTFYSLDENGFIYMTTDGGKIENQRFMFCDYSGNVTEYIDITEFYGFNDGLALVEYQNGICHYINIEGEIII